MRSAAQISCTVREWRDYEREARERHLSAFLRMCRQARANGEEWIAWVDAGCPDVSSPEGARFATHGPPARRRAQATSCDAA